MMTVIISLVQRLKDINGMSDHEMLISIYKINIATQILVLIRFDQEQCLLAIIIRVMTAIPMRNALSEELPASISDPPALNQIAKGLLKVTSVQMVGIHNANDTADDCLRSRLRSHKTNVVQIISATIGGIFLKNVQTPLGYARLKEQG